MKFSIITVTYNAETFLEETLASIAAQDYPHVEHLIWDGGSTDRTLEIAARFPHVQVHQGKDSGISDAMNRGASYATGDFLLHLHADDRLADAKVLSRVATALDTHPWCQWLYGLVEVVNEHGDSVRKEYFRPYERKRLMRYNTLSHPATFVSRALFEEMGGFDTTLSYCMDYDLWLRLAAKVTPYALPEMLSHFREHSHSLSTSEPKKVTDEAYYVRNRYVKGFWQRWRSYRTWKRRCQKIEDTIRCRA